MRRLLPLLMLLALCLPALGEETRHTVEYFYSNYCEQCDPAGEFAEQLEQLTGLKAADCDYTAWNTVRGSGQAALDAAIERYGLTDVFLPMVIVDGKAYMGAEQMNTALASESLSWGGTNDSAIVYLYVPACESCAKARQTLDALPESVTLTRGSVRFESAVTVTEIDVSEQPETANALFEAYSVPDDERVTPIAFFADRYLSGADAIAEKLPKMVSLGWAVGGVSVDVPEEASLSPVTALGAAGAGLAAGFNTCALSMLLLFLTMVMEAKTRPALLTVCFLAAKFVCYLLIGYVLLGVMQTLDPEWLKPLARWTMTLIGAALIGMNLWDAIQARRGEYGKVRNQLPRGLRGGLNRVIRAMTRASVLVPAVILLGFIVAAGEFLCAGQLYLMQLLAQAQSGAAGQKLDLVIYCLAFIAPAAALSAVVLRGRRQARASVFLAEHMDIFKLVTALVMAGMVAAAWIL